MLRLRLQDFQDCTLRDTMGYSKACSGFQEAGSRELCPASGIAYERSCLCVRCSTMGTATVLGYLPRHVVESKNHRTDPLVEFEDGEHDD